MTFDLMAWPSNHADQLAEAATVASGFGASRLLYSPVAGVPVNELRAVLPGASSSSRPGSQDVAAKAGRGGGPAVVASRVCRWVAFAASWPVLSASCG